MLSFSNNDGLLYKILYNSNEHGDSMSGARIPHILTYY